MITAAYTSPPRTLFDNFMHRKRTKYTFSRNQKFLIKWTNKSLKSAYEYGFMAKEKSATW